MKMFSDVTFAELAARGVGMERAGRPSIQPNHIDGPLLNFSDGQLHWLGPWERIQFALGWTDAEKLQRKLRPRLSAEIDARCA